MRRFVFLLRVLVLLTLLVAGAANRQPESSDRPRPRRLSDEDFTVQLGPERFFGRGANQAHPQAQPW